ncbi:MAG: HAD-IIIA family hydrolase [Puniceicoccales bacterium]|nr:HAD-IIIA family hydrolase [Puniceicoccales bacterium]
MLSPKPFAKALFLDRDNTLVHDPGYLHDPHQVRLLPGVIEALKWAKEAGHLLFLISNQSGVGRGFFTLEQALICTQRMVEQIGLGEELFREICLATETPDDPPVYRKPSPRFILEMIEKYTLDPHRSWMIGDRWTDVQTGINAGIRSLFLAQTLPSGVDETFLRHHAVPHVPTLREAIPLLATS